MREVFIVRKSVHRDSPTLSAPEASVRWYGEPSQPGTSFAAVDGLGVFRALPCPKRSTPLAVATILTVGTGLSSSAQSAGFSLGLVGRHSRCVWLNVFFFGALDSPDSPVKGFCDYLDRMRVPPTHPSRPP